MRRRENKDPTFRRSNPSLEASFRRVTWAGSPGHYVERGTAGYSRENGNCLVLLGKGESFLSVPENSPLCFLKSNRFANVGESSLCFEQFIPLCVCDFAKQLDESVLFKPTIAKY